MPVSVKEYLESMQQIGSSQASASQGLDLKTQSLLAQLIEAISYANSIDFRQKVLNDKAPTTDATGREVLETMRAQEALIDQLAKGQELSKEQNEKLIDAIDKFYELTTTQEVDYKKFADQLEHFAMRDLPESVQNRLINDSRDAHMIGTGQKQKDGLILPIIKRIKYLLEDSAEATKQFGKKLFVKFDEFKEGFANAFDSLSEKISSGGLFEELIDGIKNFGMLYMLFSSKFKMGDFKFGQLFKQFDNVKTMFKAFSQVGFGGALKSIKTNIAGLKSIFKTVSRIPKFLSKLGFLKGTSAITKSLGKGLAKGLGKGALKKIPLLGTLLSIWMGIDRWKKKQYAQALIEFGSGIAAMFPGVGTLISIGLDLINLGIDTGFFKGVGNAATGVFNKLSDDAKLAIPIIGPIIGISRSIKLWKSGDKMGALKLAWTALSPFGQIANGIKLFQELLELGSSEDPFKPDGSTPKAPEKKSTWWNPFSWGQQGAADDTKPSKPGKKSAVSSSFGTQLAEAATAIGGKNTKSTGWCARKVGDALSRVIGEKETRSYRGNAWTWIPKLDKSKYFNKAGMATKDSDLKKLPAGSIAVWNKQAAHPYGHIEIADGKGRLISDFARTANLKLYKSNPANIKPLIYTPKNVPVPQLASLESPKGQTETSSSNDISGTIKSKMNSNAASSASTPVAISSSGSEVTTESAASAQPSMTFDAMMQAFSKFNEDIVAGVNTTANASPQQMPAVQTLTQYNQNLAAGMPNTPASAPAPAKPAQTQVVQTTMSKGQPSVMDKDIQDTDLAILNSILFS